MRGTRRFSQAISEGDGISVVVDVPDAESARRAEAQGAEGIVVRGALAGVREATSLPILWCGQGGAAQAQASGADACLLDFDRFDEDELVDLHSEVLAKGLDPVVRVRDEEELALALERIDPEILLLAPARDEPDDDALEAALDLLPDVPAGKLAVAEIPFSGREAVVALERAGIDAVIVGAGDVAELVGASPPQV